MAQGGVDQRLIAFAEVLRASGLPVSQAELLVAARGLALIGWERRPLVQATLRTSLAKTSADTEVFDRVFEIFFKLAEPATPGEGAPLDGVDPALAAALEALGPINPALAALLGQPKGRLALQLSQAAQEAGLSGMQSFMQQGLYTRRLLSLAGFDDLPGALEALRLEHTGAREPGIEALFALGEARLAWLQALARAEVERAWRARQQGREGEQARRLEERPLYALSRAEILQMRETVAWVARRLADRLARRRRQRHHGHLDPSRTLRRSLAYGGVPFDPVYRRRAPKRPDLVLLVDISDSVRNVARFFLHLAYALQESVSKVRSFVFVSALGEATRLFRDADIHRAVDRAFAGEVISVYASSDYGRALLDFQREHLGAVGPRTTVIVLGDGRNNNNPARAEVLDDLRARARRLIWLCPEPEASWGFGDSEMLTYAARCDHAAPVRTLHDLRVAFEQALS